MYTYVYFFSSSMLKYSNEMTSRGCSNFRGVSFFMELILVEEKNHRIAGTR